MCGLAHSQMFTQQEQKTDGRTDGTGRDGRGGRDGRDGTGGTGRMGRDGRDERLSLYSE